MTKSQKRFFSVLPAIILISSELIRTYLRPVYGLKKYGVISEILGWLPNFLAPLGFITIGITVVILMEDISSKQFTKQQSILLLMALSVVGLLGFIGHEVTQKETGLVYDVNDIYATCVGTLFGALLFYWTIIRPKKISTSIENVQMSNKGLPKAE